RIAYVATLLQRHVVGECELVDHRRTERTNRRQRPLSAGLGAGVADLEPEQPRCTARPLYGKHVDLKIVLCARRIVRKHGHNLARAGERVEERTGHYLTLHLVQPELERSNNAEVPTASANAPEQIGVLTRARTSQSTV